MTPQTSKQAKIEELETRIKELQKIYKRDVCESFREAQQTQDMIQQLDKQLQYLKQTEEEETEERHFILKHKGEEKHFTVADQTDPANGIISKKSPIGKQLMDSKPGDKIQIGEIEWTIG